MLVIAADEGVMPQTREHLAIANWRVKEGLVALTRLIWWMRIGSNW